MSQYKILALDETGKASFNHKSSTFVLSGLIISEDYLPRTEENFRNLKNKFFGNPEIFFHSRDMLRKKGPFSILRDSEIENKFWTEFIANFDPVEISMAIVVVDKAKAKNLGWNDVAILRRAYSKIIEEFTKKHLSGTEKGRIVAESDPYQDKYLLEAHNKLQSIGIPSEGITGSSYRNKMTSISLVNKLNLDVHVQMADNLAIMSSIFYELKINKRNSLSLVEDMFRQLINRKINSRTSPGIFEVLV